MKRYNRCSKIMTMVLSSSPTQESQVPGSSPQDCRASASFSTELPTYASSSQELKEPDSSSQDLHASASFSTELPTCASSSQELKELDSSSQDLHASANFSTELPTFDSAFQELKELDSSSQDLHASASFSTELPTCASSSQELQVLASSSQEFQLDSPPSVPLTTANVSDGLQNADYHSSSLSELDFNFDSDDSLFNKNYVPSNSDSDSSTNTIPSSQQISKVIPESSDEETPQNLTKKGKIRKRMKVNVCKIFFLETLGYNKKNDKSVRHALNSIMNEIPVDKRGTNPNPKKLDDQKIIAHINSFNPFISHYRREHAPNRKYIPSDITVTKMYQDFCQQERMNSRDISEHISYDYYRKIVKKLNISFTKLGHEECEVCEIYYIHNPEYKEKSHRNCNECKKYASHREKYTVARQAYQIDVQKQNKVDINSDTVYFAADLEKVIMLPRIEEFKVVMFCPRIIAFNESFVPIGDKKCNTVCKTFAAIWHEAISGRKMQDITSCFKAFFNENRDFENIVIWLDNCAAQNKNWTLYSYLIHVVNSADVNFQTITLKYLEAGHTYMAADEFHHQVEHSMKKKKHVYDFEDFHQVVLDTRRNITVKVMNLPDFYQFEDCSSSYKLQHSSPRAYLSDMCEVTFRRGTHIIRYKTAFFNDEQEYSLDFLRLKNIKSGIPFPKPNLSCRGITQERKSAIIQKLTPLMPDNRKSFWYDLPINNGSVDLTQFYED
ncbi:hypothetical protein ABMA27_015733 [Loxostege sticticalis]|uniref:DUF7869 domain-containing protein n=1 Tax=Loxostege sticticalis TaxID=481309 RepID=A0ABR3I437_LOXSC